MTGAAEFLEIIGGDKKAIRELCLKIYRNPEVAFTEKNAAKLQKEFLAERGFEIEAPAGGLETAFMARSGKGSPVFCFMSEYDALPGLGHACGHHLICSAALAAGTALAKWLEAKKISAAVFIAGTPAEEGEGGKIIMANKGAFSGMDASLICHPYHKTITDPGWLSVIDYKVVFKGKSAHASSSPGEGINALDAANLLFAGVGAWRQQLPESSRVHGVIKNGGCMPNIIPDTAECDFFLRAADDKTQKAMDDRFKKIVEGAALMTGAEFEISEARPSYASSLFNKPLNDMIFDAAKEAGFNIERADGTGRVSSDYANVSRLAPGANFFFAATDENFPLHSTKFREAAGTDAAFERTMAAAAVMAATGARFITDKEFRGSVRADFAARSAS
jgi:amidohydrolase